MQHEFSADDGETIHVWVTGDGPPLVLLHEWASSHRIWEAFAHHLGTHFTVYRWDARGHGGHRPTVAAPVTLDRMADDLACLLAHFRLEAPTVVGHSMGALTLWAYIGRHGDGLLGRLCILDQSPKLMTDGDWSLGIYGDWTAARDAAFIEGMRTDFVETIVRLVAEGLNRAARERYESAHPGIERMRAYLGMLDPAPLIAVWPSLSHTDLRPVLPTITRPTLLIYGEESNFYPPPTADYVQAATKQSRLVVYAGADHSPHVAQPGRFVDDLARFVLGHPLVVD
jgi:Predicted hydrolases or acyltransferases (alpha/beta hydrolase superfamily)